MRSKCTDDDERDDEAEKERIGDDQLAKADGNDEIEAEVKSVYERPIRLPCSANDECLYCSWKFP